MAIGLGPGEGGILDPEGAMEHLRDWKGRIDRLAADTRTMRDRIERLRVTATADDGLAEVTIDHSGALLDLRLSHRIQRVSPDAVASAIMSAVQVARAKAAGRSREIVAETLGTESPAARAIADRVDQRLRGLQGGPLGFDDDPYRW